MAGKWQRYSPRAVVLVITVGILAILAGLGTAFFALTHAGSQSAIRYGDMVRADFCARSGVHFAVAKLQEQLLKKTEDPSDPWYPVDWLHGAARRGPAFAEENQPYTLELSEPFGPCSTASFSLEVEDAASRVNVNAGDNLAVILDNLCRILGPPLVAADPDLLQPRRWATEGADASLYNCNPADTPAQLDIYYKPGPDARPITWAGFHAAYGAAAGALGVDLSSKPTDGRAVYGDGYAIAGFRARHGRFQSLQDVKQALTYVERNGNGRPDDPLEQLEIEVKFAVLKDYLTVDSWVDTTTVGVGKFEWAVPCSSGEWDTLIDRDKSWVEHDLAGSYVSVMNGHGAGQLRRIADNGLDWLKVEVPLTVGPGPISSFMVIAREDALLEDVPGTSPPVKLPRTDPVTGALVDDPGIDYSRRPLCIHRAPVNLNTASPVVLAALFLGLNVQHGHPMSIGTDADRRLIWPDAPPAPPGDATTWVTCDPKLQEPYLLTVRGLKRLPANSGKIAFDRPMPTGASDFEYLNRYGALDPAGSGNVTEAHELAYRILLARQDKEPDGTPLGNDPLTGLPRGPFRSWDDLYFRVIKPWQKERLDPAKNPDAEKKWEVAPMLMAHFNPNTDLLKFNPNIEWIDRWGRNFTEMEPVMVFETDASGQPTVPLWVPGDAQNMWSYCEVTYGGRPKGAYYTRSLRYRSEELIDKTDLNRSTTEFSFDSNGIYHVRSTGQMMMGGQLLAERKLETLVKVYDVWRESTQRQFVQGVISKARGRPGGDASGQIVRDARNVNDRLALTTLPEPLVPLGYRIPDPGRLTDVVGGMNDAFGKAKPRDLPDVLANRILPALYDGQLVLATNTMDRSDHTTFLASFDGDLDTTTCDGNGREQAKIPVNRRVRALDTISLLGLLNDRQVDFDLMDQDNDANGNVHKTQAQFNTFPVSNLNKTLRALRPKQYWDHVTCRMGDLRADGVFLGNVGCSGKDATLKYLVDGNWPIAKSSEGTVCLWFKPNWQCTDNREHEFFNACNRGTGFGARYNILVKFGRFSWCIPQGGGGDDGVACSGGQHVGFNDLCFNLEDRNDADCKTYLHGGKVGVPGSIRESPAYHVQPFRWGFVGGRADAKQKGDNSPEYSGFWKGLSADGRNSRDAVITSVMRPFIDSARDPEGKGTWNSRYFWKQMNVEQFAALDIGTRNRQCAAWDWADGGTADSNAVFGANNLNMAGVPKSQWLYRASPIDGTLAVVDEYRLSGKCWDSDTIRKWMTTSRYYLPDHPDSPSECPMFVSQSLIQSLRGFDKTAPKEPEYVRVARVSWNVFTPRFLYENKEPKGTRKEIVKTSLTDDSKVSSPAAASYRGPFDFVQYNHDILPGLVNNNSTLPYEPDVNPLVSRLANGVTVYPLHCNRPPPPAYGGWSQAARGVEVELLDTAAADDFGSPPLLGLTFRNPDLHNSVTDAAGRPALVAADRLRYRVRFRYPVDPLVDPGKGEWVNPAEHYLVDTPVFDDISITYFPKSRIVDYREVNE